MRPAARLALLLAVALAPSSARAEYCIDYAAWLVKRFGRANYCWPTKDACEAYYRSRCLNPTYAHDCASSCYPAPGTRPDGPKGGAAPAPGAAAAAQAEAQLKLLKAAKQREDAAAQREFRQGLQGLQAGLKGPPPAGSALGQASALAGSGADAAREAGGPGSPARLEEARAQAGWPGLHPAPPPALARPPDPKVQLLDAAPAAATAPRWLLDALAGSRRELASQDAQVQALERRVAEGEARAKAAAPAPATSAPSAKAPAADDEALRQAREALARARANRERTRAELERLEREAATPAPAAGDGPQRP